MSADLSFSKRVRDGDFQESLSQFHPLSWWKMYHVTMLRFTIQNESFCWILGEIWSIVHQIWSYVYYVYDSYVYSCVILYVPLFLAQTWEKCWSVRCGCHPHAIVELGRTMANWWSLRVCLSPNMVTSSGTCTMYHHVRMCICNRCTCLYRAPTEKVKTFPVKWVFRVFPPDGLIEL